LGMYPPPPDLNDEKLLHHMWNIKHSPSHTLHRHGNPSVSSPAPQAGHAGVQLNNATGRASYCSAQQRRWSAFSTALQGHRLAFRTAQRRQRWTGFPDSWLVHQAGFRKAFWRHRLPSIQLTNVLGRSSRIWAINLLVEGLKCR
jgi:hypothetical protein